MSYRRLTLPFFILLPFPAFAEPISELNTIIVTASRINEKQSLPANITIISASDIKRSPARTLPELLSQETGVNTTSLFSHGSRASIGLRGFGETATQNTLILLDGRRLNDIDLSSVNFSAIPFENIERIEIIRGSGAVLYGDGATGGVINIITKDPRESKNYAKLSATGGSFDHREGNAFGTYSNDHFGISANINSSKNDGYRDNNKFEQDSGQFDLRIPISTGEIYWKLGAFKQDLELPGVRTVDPTSALNELASDRKGSNTLNDWANEDTEYTTLGYSVKLNSRDTLIIDGGYRKKEQQSQFDFGFGFGSYQDTSIRTLSLTPRLLLAREIGAHTIDWTLGADIYSYKYNSDRSDFKSNSNQPIHKINVDQSSTAFYAQGTINIFNNDATFLTAGWRTQKVSQKATDTYDATASGAAFGSEADKFHETDQENSYELGLKHLFNDKWSAYGSIGRSARFGTVDELFEFNSIFQQVFSELEPQISQNVELGVSYNNHWLTSSLAIFHQDIENEIHFNPATFQNINFDDTKHDGIELSADVQLNASFSIKASYTYLNAESTKGELDGKDIPLIPQDTYHISVYGNLPHNIKSAISWNYVSSSYFANDGLNDFEEKIPSYQTVDLKLSKDFSGLEIAVQVNNVFNEKYFNFGVNSTATAGRFNAYPMPERTAYISASYQFD
ncbi:MAG: TonB-dependent receptor [Methylophagaceae bacterium]